jgi:BirA family biotin operon repressor/biotin-[acetyl-CoA-carboxylase] ligase
VSHPSDPRPDDRRAQVLAALARAGQAGVSGEALAAEIGCSRAAVHRHVEALRRDGIPVRAGSRGYRLPQELDLVVPELLAPRLREPLGGPVEWLRVTGSTNDDLATRARAGAPEGLVIGADHQTAGRGRRGRAWSDRAGDGLMLSVLLRPRAAPVEVGTLPLVVAVAVAEALAGLGVEGVGIAWPNDVLVAGRKVAGILCELSADQERVDWVVAGIGLNVRRPPEIPDARWPPGSLADVGTPAYRLDLATAVLVELSRRYGGWRAAGPAEALRAYAARDALRGRPLSVTVGDRVITGDGGGVDELGRLVVGTPEGVRALASGEVTRVEL